MPVETLVVDGKQYLYFYYYDAATKRKKRVYCGPKASPEALKKAKQFESRYEKTQDQKSRFTGVIGKLSALSSEVDGYKAEERDFIVTHLLEAYSDLTWVVSDQMALFGRLNAHKSLFNRVTSLYDRLKSDATRIHDVEGELRLFIADIDPDWYFRVRYRKPGEGEDRPDWDPSLKYHRGDDPENMVVEILRGWLDAYDHALRRLDTLEEFCRNRNLHAVIEALGLIGVRKAMADSKELVEEALGLIVS